MLTEICQELRNWFDRDQPKIYDTFEVSGGHIITDGFTEAIQNNQYFRIIGSVFNDGVHKYSEALILEDETFDGAIWLMAIPKDIVSLSETIDKWLKDNSAVMLSPYSSESFGGYSYVKRGSGSGSVDGSGSGSSWQSVFASELNRWRKI